MRVCVLYVSRVRSYVHFFFAFFVFFSVLVAHCICSDGVVRARSSPESMVMTCVAPDSWSLQSCIVECRNVALLPLVTLDDGDVHHHLVRTHTLNSRTYVVPANAWFGTHWSDRQPSVY